MAGWMFFMVEKERMGEMCVANSSSSCDNISFTGSVYGGSPFLYGFFNIF